MKKVLSILLTIIMIVSAIPIAVFAENETGYKVGDHIQFGNYPQSQETDEEIIAQLDAMEKDWKNTNLVITEDILKKMANGEALENENYYYSYAVCVFPGPYLKIFIDYADIDFDADGKRDYRAVTFERYLEFADGQEVSKENLEPDFGLYADGFSKGEVYYFKYEPITWRVLDPDDGLIMSESLLDAMEYNNCVICAVEKSSINDEGDNMLFFGNEEMTAKANDYAESSIRKWLNNEFLNAAFSEEQKAIIKADVALNNDAVAKYYATYTDEEGNASLLDEVYENNTNQYSEAYDKIFLLSSMDIVNPDYGFERDEYGYREDEEYAFNKLNESRDTTVTDYTLSQGLRNGYKNWWLRTPSYNTSPGNIMSDLYANYVYNSLYMPFSYMGAFAHPSYENYGVRPACRLTTLKNDTEKAYIEGYQPTSGQCGDNAYWSYDVNTATLTITGTGETSVTDGERGWESYKDNVKHIVISDGITKIGDAMFAIMFNVETVDLGNTVETIGVGSFVDMISLDSIEIPSSVKLIDDYAFLGSKLKSITFNEGLEEIGGVAFAYCFTDHITIPSTVREIDPSAFATFAIDSIINYSETAVCRLSTMGWLENPYDEILFMFQVTTAFAENPEDVDSEEYKKLVEDVNKKFGMNFKDVIELNEVLESKWMTEENTEGIPDYFYIECLPNSAQHEYCKENNISHYFTDFTCDFECGIHASVSEYNYFAPTCTENGFEGGKVCTVCLANATTPEEEEAAMLEAPTVLPATGHSLAKIEGVEPTCTSTGLTEGVYCKTCLEIMVAQTEIPALDHKDINNDGICDNCGRDTGNTDVDHSEPQSFGERIIAYFRGIVNAILELFRRIFG